MDKKQTLRYFSVLQALYFAATGLWSYVNIYLRELGFTGQQLGNITAVATFSAIVLLPMTGMLADKLRSPKRVFSWAVCILLPMFLLYPVLGGIYGARLIPILLLSAVLRVCNQVAGSSLESWNGMEMERIGVSYGVIRRFGSLGFVFMCLVATALVGPVLPSWSCCVIMPLVGLPLMLMLRKPGTEMAMAATATTEKFSGKKVLRYVFCNYYFLVFLLLHLAFSAFQGTVNLCLSYLMDYAGASRSSLGIVSSVRAGVEIVAMFWLSSAKRKPPHWVILGIACMLVAVEHLIYPWMTSLPLMVAASLLTGFGGGLYFGISANFVLQIVDCRAASTAMAVLGVVKAAAAIVGTAWGGGIIDRYGVTTLTTGVGLLTVVLTAVFLGACFLGRVLWKKPYHSEKTETSVL